MAPMILECQGRKRKWALQGVLAAKPSFAEQVLETPGDLDVKKGARATALCAHARLLCLMSPSKGCIRPKCRGPRGCVWQDYAWDTQLSNHIVIPDEEAEILLARERATCNHQ